MKKKTLLLVQEPFSLQKLNGNDKLGKSNELCYRKKNPVEVKHCQTSSSCKISYLIKLKPQKEKVVFLILEYETVKCKPRIVIPKLIKVTCTLLHETISISSCPPSWIPEEDFAQFTSNLKISLFQMKLSALFSAL